MGYSCGKAPPAVPNPATTTAANKPLFKLFIGFSSSCSSLFSLWDLQLREWRNGQTRKYLRMLS